MWLLIAVTALMVLANIAAKLGRIAESLESFEDEARLKRRSHKVDQSNPRNTLDTTPKA